LAIAHKIAQLGIPANIAVTLATKFTDEPQNGRPLGGTFPIGTTYVLAKPNGVALVVNLKPEEDVSRLLDDATIVVNVSRIISSMHLEIGAIN
jgi:hypothetical protein